VKERSKEKKNVFWGKEKLDREHKGRR